MASGERGEERLERMNDASAWMLRCHQGLEFSSRHQSILLGLAHLGGTLAITFEIPNETLNFMGMDNSATGQPAIVSWAVS